jgi:hypothetical protein
MARLDHPNIITVHDVGEFDGRAFIAMEFVDGQTLKQWGSERVRSWREVLEVARSAGAGLAAAHRAGFIHRDFKPENVLVSRHGEVRVTDFGLVRSAAAHRPEPSTPRPSPVAAATQTGAHIGTVAYMAPEQLLGSAADARSDQFPFCMTLYELWCGTPAFPGRTLEERTSAVRAGTARPFPPSSPVPAALRKATLRGLSVDPALRFETMDALLGALAPPSRTRWPLLATAAATAAALAVAAGGWSLERASRCQGAAQELSAIWGPAPRSQVERAFRQSGAPLAAEAFGQLADVLDRRAEDWVREHTAACRATRIDGSQSELLLDARMACLEQRRRELAALTVLLKEPDLKLIERAASAANGLTPVSSCADLTSLLRARRPPADPARRAATERVEQLLTEADANELAGRVPKARQLAEAALAAARELPDERLVGVASRHLAWILDILEEDKAAEESFRAAVLAAEGAGDDGSACPDAGEQPPHR